MNMNVINPTFDTGAWTHLSQLIAFPKQLKLFCRRNFPTIRLC